MEWLPKWLMSLCSTKICPICPEKWQGGALSFNWYLSWQDAAMQLFNSNISSMSHDREAPTGLQSTMSWLKTEQNAIKLQDVAQRQHLFPPVSSSSVRFSSSSLIGSTASWQNMEVGSLLWAMFFQYTYVWDLKPLTIDTFTNPGVIGIQTSNQYGTIFQSICVVVSYAGPGNPKFSNSSLPPPFQNASRRRLTPGPPVLFRLGAKWRTVKGRSLAGVYLGVPSWIWLKNLSLVSLQFIKPFKNKSTPIQTNHLNSHHYKWLPATSIAHAAPLRGPKWRQSLSSLARSRLDRNLELKHQWQNVSIRPNLWQFSLLASPMRVFLVKSIAYNINYRIITW